ncbi:hypothetical protein Kpol_513p33 [Vanderwaltozyma polyspora DSM 70294]|uniref:Major facilitator superfamily (MFS) profile domain-containing protein n=1 Tax=Vanderwaltozyma polyspora (strain ATCC 22028 / DSM 70294 / BCRC 21397 / CBS 2163 / NBRC 10782 / NRRL Y-8283 / UCD 57-17) TaxID=436907 RepID=A7TML9_VANPO|nr:uncharacterized protein Kpol_513p33 [Vanderwaltozyma polyspora DSM 70294]EDO16517.1 hypothetical protein Kpol_513p33 [Vanderwaltozyma polyspora DSM 70294]
MSDIKYQENLKTKTFDEDAKIESISVHTDSENIVTNIAAHNARIYVKYYSTPLRVTILYFSLFLLAYAYNLHKDVRGTYQTLATSSYSKHSLLATVQCINQVISAAGQIWYARASDIFGRTPILILSILFYFIGTLIESQATDISKYAAGSCIYALGYAGSVLVTQVLVSDYSTLKWRLVSSTVLFLPNIINTWVGGNITEDVGNRWQWGFGMWAFIFPLASIPLLCCLAHMKYLAIKNKEDVKLTISKPRSISWARHLYDIFFWKLDMLGLILLVAFFALILVPLTLAKGLHEGWGSAKFIVPEVLGWALALPLFLTWELKFASNPITPLDLIKDRGIYGGIGVSLFLEFVYDIGSTYLYTVLVVAVNESTKSATRITSLFTFVSVLTAFFLGFVVVKVRRTKEFIIFGIAMWYIAYGLFEHYRGGAESHAGIIAAVCVHGFGNGFIKFPVRVSTQASAKTHDRLAIATSLYLAAGDIGMAFGSATAGAMWTNILPAQIDMVIQNSTLAKIAYESPIKFIRTHKWDSPERQALVVAYRYIQRLLMIVALCLIIPLLLSSFFLRNRALTDTVAFEQTDIPKESDSSDLENSKIDNLEEDSEEDSSNGESKPKKKTISRFFHNIFHN